MADDIVNRLRQDWAESDDDMQSVAECAAEEIERLTQHSVILNRVSWQLYDALGLIPEGADRYWGDIEAMLPTICQIIEEGRRA